MNQSARTQSVTIQMKFLGEYVLMMVLVCNSEPDDENSKGSDLVEYIPIMALASSSEPFCTSKTFIDMNLRTKTQSVTNQKNRLDTAR